MTVLISLFLVDCDFELEPCFRCSYIYRCHYHVIIVFQEVFPIARKLGERVLENCATKLKPYLVQSVKTLGISVDDYSNVLASICKDTSDSLEKNGVCVTGEHVVSFLSVLCQLIFEIFYDEKLIIDIHLVILTFAGR